MSQARDLTFFLASHGYAVNLVPRALFPSGSHTRREKRPGDQVGYAVTDTDEIQQRAKVELLLSACGLP